MQSRPGRQRALIAGAMGLALTMSLTTSGGPSRAASPDADEVRHAASLREASGLAADAATLRDSYSDPRYANWDFGIPLTPAEANAIEEIRRQQARTEPMLEAAHDVSGFVSAYYDGGRLYLVVSKDSGLFEAELAARVPLEGAYEIRQIGHSLEQLDVARRAVAADLKELGAAGIHVFEFGVEPIGGRLEIVVSSQAPPNVADLLSQRYGAVVDVRVADDYSSSLLCTKDSCGTRGGLGVKKVVTCTSAFVVRNVPVVPYNPTYYMLTAGHCIKSGGGVGAGPWKNTAATVTWGNGAGQYFFDGAYGDAGHFGLGSNVPSTRNTYYIGSGLTRSIGGKASDSTQAVGKLVCRHGWTSDYDCGYIRATWRTVILSGYQLHSMWKAELQSAGGDSGAGFIYQDSALEAWEAAGILSGGSIESGKYYTWYTTISNAESRLGLRTCVTASC